MEAPEQLSIVCPTCPETNVISIARGTYDVRCTVCHQRFRTVTRRIKDTSIQRLDAGRVRYQALTYEDSGRVRPRVFFAPPSVRINAGSWITFVYAHEHLVGIADQNNSLWYPIPETSGLEESTRRHFFTFMSLVCLVLLVGQAYRLHPLLSDLSQHPLGLIALGVGLIFFAAPAILWAFQTAGLHREERYLPEGHSAEIE